MMMIDKKFFTLFIKALICTSFLGMLSIIICHSDLFFCRISDKSYANFGGWGRIVF